MARQPDDLSLGTGLIPRKGEARGLSPEWPFRLRGTSRRAPPPTPAPAPRPTPTIEEDDPPLCAAPPDDVPKRFTSFRLPVVLDEDLRAMMFETPAVKAGLAHRVCYCRNQTMEVGADKSEAELPLNWFCQPLHQSIGTGVLRPRPLHRLRANALIVGCTRTGPRPLVAASSAETHELIQRLHGSTLSCGLADLIGPGVNDRIMVEVVR